MTSLIMFAHCNLSQKWNNKPHNRGFDVPSVPEASTRLFQRSVLLLDFIKYKRASSLAKKQETAALSKGLEIDEWKIQLPAYQN